MRKFALAATLLSATFMVPTVANAAPIIANGDFEAGLTGWVVAPFNDIKATTGQDYIDHAGGTGSAAAAANHLASFGSGDQPNLSLLLANPFTTVAGTLYTLSFDFATFGGAAASQTLTYKLYGTGFTTLTGTETKTGNTNLDTTFSHYTVNFVGSNNPISLFFTIAGQTTGSVDALLDNVSIKATGVPETSTWAMMIGGFGMIGGAMRRRRSTTRALKLA